MAARFSRRLELGNWAGKFTMALVIPKRGLSIKTYAIHIVSPP